MRRAAKTMKMIVHTSSSPSWDFRFLMNPADRFQKEVWGDVVPFSYGMLRSQQSDHRIEMCYLSLSDFRLP